MVPWNSASGGFAYIWQSKKGGIIAIKTEGTQIHFLSDVLAIVASLDLKVPIETATHNESSHKRFGHEVIMDLKKNAISSNKTFKEKTTPPGFEPGIPWFVARCLIRWSKVMLKQDSFSVLFLCCQSNKTRYEYGMGITDEQLRLWDESIKSGCQ